MLWMVALGSVASAALWAYALRPLPGIRARRVAPGGDLACLFDIRAEAMRRWQAIVIHHSATDVGNAERFDRYHRQARGWSQGLAYHFVIGNGRGSGDGEIEVAQRWLDQLAGAHAGDRDLNEVAIGICLVGNFEEREPTPAQMASLVRLVIALQRAFAIPRDKVILHCEVREGHTVCPGRHFPAERLRAQILP